MRGKSDNICRVSIEGSLPKSFSMTKAELKKAAESFAAQSSRRIKVPFRAVTVVLQDDEFSAEVHEAINGVEGATDVITQRYDAMPGEEDGVYGELYVNCEQAERVAPRRANWSKEKELLLYVAHGMDHLSGADDLEERGYNLMRRRELSWLKKATCVLALVISSFVSAFANEEDVWDDTIELDRYFVNVEGKMLLPESGRMLAGAGVKGGYYLNEFWAIEAEAAMLENKGYFAADVLWHW